MEVLATSTFATSVLCAKYLYWSPKLGTVSSMQTTKGFQLLPDYRETLKRWLRRSTTPSGQTRRARILLSLDGGRSPTETARLLHISRATMHLWHRRYRADALPGLVDRPQTARPQRPQARISSFYQPGGGGNLNDR